MYTEPIIFTFACIAFVLALVIMLRRRIEANDLKRQLSDDENSYS
jgi:hypothetical protein